MHVTVSSLTNRFVSVTGNRRLGFGRRSAFSSDSWASCYSSLGKGGLFQAKKYLCTTVDDEERFSVSIACDDVVSRAERSCKHGGEDTTSDAAHASEDVSSRTRHVQKLRQGTTKTWHS